MNLNTDMSIEELQAMLEAETTATADAKEEYDSKAEERAKEIEDNRKRAEEAMRIHLPPLTIGVYADEYSWSQSDQENDMDELIKHFESIFKGDFRYKRGVNPVNAINEKMDLYIVDFGGVSEVDGNEFTSHSRGLKRLMEDKPNTLVLFGTNFTHNEYASWVRQEMNSTFHTLPHNVGLMEFGMSMEDDLKKEWVGQVRWFFGVAE